jgi:hypothetical protein
MKAYGGVDVYIHIFLTSALAGGEWSALRSDRFNPGKGPRYPLDRRLGGPRAGLHDVEKRNFLTLQELKLRPLGRSARTQPLYRHNV